MYESEEELGLALRELEAPLSDLEAKIRQIGKDRPIIIAFESVYSMD